MANYECAYRTNYFHVKDEEVFKNVIHLAQKTSEDLNCYPSNGDPTAYMIGGYGSLCLCPEYFDEGDEDSKLLENILCQLGKEDLLESEDEDIFFELLAACVRDDDAIIYMEGGHEKLRYVSMVARVITSKDDDWINIESLTLKMARDMLGNPEWNTRLTY